MIGPERSTTQRESSLQESVGSGDESITCDLAKATQEDFQKLVGDTFLLSITSEQQIDLELVEAVGCSSDSDRPRELRQPFSLLFRGSHDTQLPQSLYTMNHLAWGTFTLFLVPIGASEGEIQFEAVFN